MSSTEFKDYYAVLGVSKRTEPSEIKKKFRQLALKYHPDRNQGNKAAEAKFKAISEAYDVLGDRDKRAKYDRFGQYWEQTSSAKYNTTSKNKATNNTANTQVDLNSTDFSQYGNFDEFINELLGRFSSPNSTKSSSTQTSSSNTSGFNRSQSKSEASATSIDLTYAEAFQGVTKQLNLNLESLEVRIPAGAKPGSRIRLAGKGKSGSDLYLNVNLLPHPFFDFERDNLVCEVPIAPDEAVLGCSTSIPTPDGTVSMKIPAGINSGQVLRLRGKGWSSPGGKRTDLLVRIVVETPQRLNKREKEYYQKIRDLRQQDPRERLKGIKL